MNLCVRLCECLSHPANHHGDYPAAASAAASAAAAAAAAGRRRGGGGGGAAAAVAARARDLLLARSKLFSRVSSRQGTSAQQQITPALLALSSVLATCAPCTLLLPCRQRFVPSHGWSCVAGHSSAGETFCGSSQVSQLKQCVPNILRFALPPDSSIREHISFVRARVRAHAFESKQVLPFPVRIGGQVRHSLPICRAAE